MIDIMDSIHGLERGHREERNTTSQILEALGAVVREYGRREMAGDELQPIENQSPEIQSAMQALAAMQGMVLVPVIPTKEMTDAAQNDKLSMAAQSQGYWGSMYGYGYIAMIAPYVNVTESEE